MNFSKTLICVGLFSFLLSACKSVEKENKNNTTGFVTVNNTGFEIDGKPYHYLGTNLWYGLNLGAKPPGGAPSGNRERLIRELDRLKDLGVTNLRIMGSSEGPFTEPNRMLPSLQPKPRLYNNDVLQGLDFLLDEMKNRQMYAVVCMNNFQNWSGGIAQYLVWAGVADSIPYPPPHPGGDWQKFQDFTAQFYANEKAVEFYNRHLEFIVNRENTISGIAYKNDPTIMAWELINEPVGIKNTEAFLKWIDNTAGLIKKLDPKHLVTTGSEGKRSSLTSGNNLAKYHSSKNIDYATINMWVQNLNIDDPLKTDSSYDVAMKNAVDYLEDQEKTAKQINKPLVLEAFGISRDLNNHDAKSAVTVRDKYYAALLEEVYQRANRDSSVVAGCNFWAWGGEGRPRQPKDIWILGDEFIGDAPSEPQGCYSVYDTDLSTQAVIKDYAIKLSSIERK